MGGGGGGSKPKKQQQPSGPDPMMVYLAQMQSQQAAQAEAAKQAQQEALLESQRQSAATSARQGESGAQQFLSQTGGMQQARDIASLQAQQQAQQAAGTSAVGGGYDIAKAQQEQAANLAGIGAISRPPLYKTENAGAGYTGRPVNVFNLPKASGVTFGGV